ncbi:yellow [Carabus blaptoides fortunei]
MFRVLFYLVGVCGCFVGAQQPTRFKVAYEWNFINFTWPSDDVLDTAMKTGKYNPKNVHISGVTYFEDYLYLTVPRMKVGVPATLARIPVNANKNDTAPLLVPFPSWEMNIEGDCTALQNVQNIEIDTAGLLWILDGGRTGTLTKTPSIKCPPRLVIFDIKSNTTVNTYTFPQEMTNNGSFLYDLVVDDVDGGYAYISDNSGVDPAIIVYSMRKSQAWIIRDDTMKASPDADEFTVNGTAVQARINIAGIALGPRMSIRGNHEIVTQDRTVYYCPLSSYRMYAVSSAILRDERSAQIGIRTKVRDLGRKASQTDGMVMDENGVLYYGLLSDNSIARWDSRTPFTSGQKVIARDRAYLQWPDSLCFDVSGNLYVVTNKLQKFIFGSMDLNEPNFRILVAYVGAKSYLYSTPQEISSVHNASDTMSSIVPENTGTQDMSNKMGIQNVPDKNSSLYYETYNTTQMPETSTVNHENNSPGDSAPIMKGTTIICLTLLPIIFTKMLN